MEIMEKAEEEDAESLLSWCETEPKREQAPVGDSFQRRQRDSFLLSARDSIENFPKDGNPSYLGKLFKDLGNALYNYDDVIGAEKVYREGTRRAPGFAPCYDCLGRLLLERNDLQGAERVLQRGAKIEGAGGCCFWLGSLRELQGDLIAAAAAYREAVSLEPNEIEFRLVLGQFLENNGDKRGAEEVYRKALQMFAGFDQSYENEYEKILVNEFPSLRKLIATTKRRNR